MSLTVHVQPGGEKTVPADSFNVEAETVPDHRIQQTSVGIARPPNAKRPAAHDMRQAVLFVTANASPSQAAGAVFLGALVNLRALFHELDRLRFHALLQRLDIRYPLLRRIFTDVLGDLHRTEVRTAHRAEMRDFG